MATRLLRSGDKSSHSETAKNRTLRHDVAFVWSGQRRQLKTFQDLLHRLVRYQLHTG